MLVVVCTYNLKAQTIDSVAIIQVDSLIKISRELTNKKDFQKAIKIEKSYADAYYYLGLTEIELGDIDEAKVDFEIAAELGHEKATQLMKKYFNQ